MRISRWEMATGAVSAILLAAVVGTASGETAKVKAPSSDPDAVAKVTGNSAPNQLATGLVESPVAQGAQPLENGTDEIPFYGYHGDGPMVPAPGDVQASGHNVEASKSEPDKNTYLVLHNQGGPDSDYDYGRHFIFQGHELGIGYVTRINLDADDAHRITLWATEDSNGNPLPPIDGSTWDPWAQRLLFTEENGANGGVWQSTLDFPPLVEEISGILGRGGYEGIQNDSDGNLWIAEDVSGAKGTVNNHARQPNSFIFRFLPKNKWDLTKGGKLQALQVCRLNVTPCDPIVFHANDVDGDILSQNQKDLHTYGNQFKTNWVTVHDTDVDGTTPFDANALAKAKLATPFKRPENGQFRPGRQFKEFFFDATGDTDAATQAGSQYGGFGAVFKLTQSNPSAGSGVLSALLPRRHRPHRSGQRGVLGQEPRRLRRGSRRRSAHGAQCLRLRVALRRSHRLLGPEQPALPAPRPRPRHFGHDRLRDLGRSSGQRFPERGRQRDHGHPHLGR